MKLNDLLVFIVKQLTSLKRNGLYLLAILFETGIFPSRFLLNCNYYLL